ncbi:MAG TPA: VTT domain-containing protein [Kofleriaceae bacterium]|nr:VTT domain-containing protein [Kofleriaceae bacterium]
MTADEIVRAAGIYAGTFAVGAISSVIPLISIEVFLVAITLAHGTANAVPLIVLATVGQVLGKLPVYATTRGLAALPGPQRRWIERVRVWVARFGNRPNLVLGTSALLGLPPFSIISTAAGALAIPPRTFCAVIAVGRALRFTAIVAVAALYG